MLPSLSYFVLIRFWFCSASCPVYFPPCSCKHLLISSDWPLEQPTELEPSPLFSSYKDSCLIWKRNVHEHPHAWNCLILNPTHTSPSKSISSILTGSGSPGSQQKTFASPTLRFFKLEPPGIEQGTFCIPCKCSKPLSHGPSALLPDHRMTLHISPHTHINHWGT